MRTNDDTRDLKRDKYSFFNQKEKNQIIFFEIDED